MKLEFHQKVKKNCPRQDWTLSIFEVDSIHRKKGLRHINTKQNYSQRQLENNLKITAIEAELKFTSSYKINKLEKKLIYSESHTRSLDRPQSVNTCASILSSLNILNHFPHFD